MQNIKTNLIHEQMNLPKDTVSISPLLLNDDIKKIVFKENPNALEVYVLNSGEIDYIYVYTGKSRKYQYTRITIEYTQLD